MNPIAPLCRRLRFALLALVLPHAASAGTAEAELQAFIGNVDTLQGRFVQTQTDEHGEIVSTGAGSMAIARPGRFRWDYQQPYEQLMVCDGDRIWVYEPDLAQATVRPAAEALAGTPAELLAQRADLSDDFSIEDRGEQAGLRHVQLRPRAADSEFRSIELWLRDGVPQRLRFTDPLGGASDVELGDLQVNAGIDAERFAFRPPAGTEVVEAAAAP